MILTYLFYALFIAAFIQPNAPRLFAAVSFVMITLLHESLLSELDGLQYYGSAALFDLGVIIITSGINPVPKMVLSLHRLCIASIVANLFGWLLWFFYSPPFLYDAAFVGIYIWALYILVERDALNVGDYSLDSWASCFRFNRDTWASYFNKHGGKV